MASYQDYLDQQAGIDQTLEVSFEREAIAFSDRRESDLPVLTVPEADRGEGPFAPLAGAQLSTLTSPQQAALDSFLSRAPRIIDEARACASITDESTLQIAVILQQDVQAAIDLLEAFKRPEINRAYQAHKAALAELQSLTAPWRTAQAMLSDGAAAYQMRLRREREDAARQVQEEMQRVRDRELAIQLEQAAQAGAQEEVQAVLERAAIPLPEIPIIHTPVRVEGSITRGKHTYTLVDARKINLQWVLECILAEIATKGECKWLSTQIGREVRDKGKRAEEVVGVGSIEYSAGVSAGVRRRKG